MASYSLDAETFISEVKKYPQIWNMNCEGSRHKTKKIDAWMGVARVFIPDLDSMSEADKYEVFRKLHSKWRNLRDAYVRNLKRKDGKRNYMYAKQMSFLNVIYQQEPESDNDTSEDDKKYSRARQIEVNTSVDNYQSEEESSSTIDNLKRRRLARTENIEFVSTVPQEGGGGYLAEDADRSFFESVLPAVREFDMDQKLEFRSEVLRLIKSIRCAHNNHLGVPVRDIKIDHIVDYSE